MYHKLILALVVLAFPFSITSAVEIISGPISADLEYPDGVVLENATASDSSTATATIEGTGSITVFSQIGGGFPRMQLIGGTTITSKRTWGEGDVSAEAWAGQVAPPATSRFPSSNEISFSGGDHGDSSVEVVGAYAWGLPNEVFSYSPKATVAFEVREPNGQKIWFAYPKDGGWTIAETDFCLVSNNVCVMDLATASAVVLAKELFTTCPRDKISNGTVGTTPICRITCDQGFSLNTTGTSCVGLNGESSGDVEVSSTSSETGGQVSQDNFNESAYLVGLPEKEYEFPPGHFKYRESGSTFRRFLPEYELKDEEKELAQHLNTGYLTRNPRSAEEQFAARGEGPAEPGMTEAQEDNFINYMLSMRDQFSSETETRGTVQSQGVSDDSEGGASPTGSAQASNSESSASDFRSSAGQQLLPSAGPEIFITLAIMGVLLMLFGSKRRN